MEDQHVGEVAGHSGLDINYCASGSLRLLCLHRSPSAGHTHSNSTALGFRCQLDSIGGSQRSPREDSYLINKVSSTLTSLGPKKCSRSSIGDLGKEVALGGDIARRRDDTESESRFSAQPLPGQFRSLSDMRCCAIYYEVTACSYSTIGSEGEHVALGQWYSLLAARSSNFFLDTLSDISYNCAF